MSLQIGDKLDDRFEITRALTSGGMGSVYEARDRLFGGRRCAIKMLLAHLLVGQNAESFRARFQAEIKMLEKLSHPSIPRYIASIENEAGFFLVMEFVQGRNLEQELEERIRLTSGPFPVDQALRDARQILDLLDHLHSLSPPLIHRDIKPANLIREHPTGRVKLVDFGLARSLENSQTQTQIGTLGYAPLEQLQGKAEARSDLYALGASLHHLLSGETPKPLDISPIQSSRPDLSADLVAWLAKSVAPEAKSRFASAREMLAELNKISPTIPLVILGEPPRADDRAPDPTRIFTAASPTRMMEDEVTPPPPVVPLELPEPEVVEPEPVLEPASSPPQPPPRNLNPLWAALLVVGTGLAFLAGRATHPPEESSLASVAAAPAETSSVTPAPPEPTSTPQALPARPLVTPTPIVVHNRRRFVQQQAAPRPSPGRTATPEEPHEQYSLKGPGYPTRSGGEPVAIHRPAKAAPVQTIQRAFDEKYAPNVNLSADWVQASSIHSSQEFKVAYQKAGPTYDAGLRFTIRSFPTNQSKDRVKQSFDSQRAGWSQRQDLGGIDEAYERTAHGSHEVEALVTRPGRYYTMKLEAHSDAVPDESFQKELNEAIGGVDIP